MGLIDLLALFVTPLLLGHVLYGIPRRVGDGRALVTLHNGDDFNDRDQAPRPERLSRVRAHSATDTTRLEAVGSSESGVSVDVTGIQPPAWLVVESAPAFIELAAEAFTKYLEHEGLTSVVEQRAASGESHTPGREVYSKYAKVALGDSHNSTLFSKPVGLPIELIPVRQPRLNAYAVRLVLQGRPASDAQVQVHWKADEASTPARVACGRTDTDGVFSFYLGTRGLWRLHAISMSPHEDPTVAAWRSVWASLTFVIGESG